MAEGENVGAEASVAAANAAVVAAETVAAIELNAEARVEHAEARVEAAEAVAQQITDAALLTKLGEMVAALQTDVEKWHLTLAQFQTTAGTEIAALKLEISALKTPVVALIRPSLPPALPKSEPGPLENHDPTRVESENHMEAELPIPERKKTKRFV